MKKTKPVVLGLFTFLFGSAIFSGIHFYREYKVGDYVEKAHGYVAEVITDETAYGKAHKFITPTDNKFSTQKQHGFSKSSLGDLESVWDSYTGKGTTVAIIDDGFDTDHPEYIRSDNSCAILGTSKYFYTSGYYSYGSEDTFATNPSIIEEDWDTDGNEWATHGTNTSTTAAAPMGNGGGVGIAPDANILALKIDMSYGAVKAAINYAVDQGVDVINMSIGGFAETFTDGFGDEYTDNDVYTGLTTYLNDACQAAYDAGIIVVASAGNEATWHKSYPACSSKVIGVGALGHYYDRDNGEILAEFTNYVHPDQTGEVNVDILAPGFVYTAHKLGTQSSVQHGYSDTYGTSFSSPIVAGAACLWKEKNPSGTPDQFLDELQASAQMIGGYKDLMVETSGWDSDVEDVGPSNIECGRLDVGNLLLNYPYINVKTENINIATGENKQIQLGTYNGTIAYTSGNTNVATVSDTGLVTGTGAGSTTITVTATSEGKSESATINVTVTELIACTALNLSTNQLNLVVGEVGEVEPLLMTTPANATRQFLYESSDSSVVYVDEDNGELLGCSAGTATITIVAGYGSGEAYLTVNVTAPTTPTSFTKVTSSSEITNGDYLIVYESSGRAFNGGLSSLDVTNNYISVTISNSKITYNSTTSAAKFRINSVTGGYSIKSASGSYIGRSASSNGIDSSTSNAYVNTISISSGLATITGTGNKILSYNTANDQNRFRYMSNSSNIALYKASGGGSGSVAVTGVTLNKSSTTLTVGNTETLLATVAPNDASNKAVTWTSSNTSVASVSSSGVITANAAGSATITVTTSDGGFTANCTVTVNAATVAVTSVALNKSSTSLEVGENETLVATVSPNNATNKNVTWTTSNSNVATVNAGTVTAVAAGSATITVTTVDGNKTATCTVTVTEPISGDTHNYNGTFTYSDVGTTWTISNSIDNSSYWLVPADGTTSVALFPGIFTNKIVNSDVVITINNATYGNGTDPSANTFKIYGEQACTTQISATQSGALPTSKTYKDTIYTVAKATATSAFNDDLAILITKPGKQVRLCQVSISFTYVNDDRQIASLSATYNGGNVYVGNNFDPSKVSVTATFTNSEKYPAQVLSNSDYSLSTLDSSTPGNKTITVTYTGKYDTSTSPLTTTFTVPVIADEVTNVTVTCSKSFKVGETISKSDITVTLSWASGKANTTTTDFTFSDDGYQFTYSDAASGGVSTQKAFSITYAGNNYNFTVNVSRTNYVAPSSSQLTLTGTQVRNAGVNGTSASEIANYSSLDVNGVTCAATNIYVYLVGTTNYISFGKDTGEIHNTTPLDKAISSFTLTHRSGAREDEKLYVSQDGTNWVLLSSADLSSTNYYYFKVAYETSSSSYSNFNNINLGLKGSETATNIANYVMYEDTNNQCQSKTSVALTRFSNMSKEEKTTFMTSDNYVISTARERLLAWCANQNKSIVLNGDEYVVANSKFNIGTGLNSINNGLVLIISLTAIGTILGGFGYHYYRHKKEVN